MNPLIGSIIALYYKKKVLDIWYAVLVLIVFLVVYFLLILLSRSIDKEDVELLMAIEKRVEIDLNVVRRVLEKFV